jgi:hypothetical protein
VFSLDVLSMRRFQGGRVGELSFASDELKASPWRLLIGLRAGRRITYQAVQVVGDPRNPTGMFPLSSIAASRGHLIFPPRRGFRSLRRDRGHIGTTTFTASADMIGAPSVVASITRLDLWAMRSHNLFAPDLPSADHHHVSHRYPREGRACPHHFRCRRLEGQGGGRHHEHEWPAAPSGVGGRGGARLHV